MQKRCGQLLDKDSVLGFFLTIPTIKADLPVTCKCLCDCITNKFTILLQGVQRILDGLVNSLLNCAAHLFDLVHTAAWLQTDKNRGLKEHRD